MPLKSAERKRIEKGLQALALKKTQRARSSIGNNCDFCACEILGGQVYRQGSLFGNPLRSHENCYKAVAQEYRHAK